MTQCEKYGSGIERGIKLFLNMEKNFDEWNEQKKMLEQKTKRYLFKEADVWWCSIGVNVAEESSGKGMGYMRPVLILKKLSDYSFICLPLSTKRKVGSWFVDVFINGKKNVVQLHQIRYLTTNRLQRHLVNLEKDDFARIKQKLEALLELSDNHQDTCPGSVGLPQK